MAIGLRRRNSPTCTLSQNGYGTSIYSIPYARGGSGLSEARLGPGQEGQATGAPLRRCPNIKSAECRLVAYSRSDLEQSAGLLGKGATADPYGLAVPTFQLSLTAIPSRIHRISSDLRS